MKIVARKSAPTLPLLPSIRYFPLQHDNPFVPTRSLERGLCWLQIRSDRIEADRDTLLVSMRAAALEYRLERENLAEPIPNEPCSLGS